MRNSGEKPSGVLMQSSAARAWVSARVEQVLEVNLAYLLPLSRALLVANQFSRIINYDNEFP